MKIVIAEDEEALAKALQTKFKNAGFDIYPASDGVQALEMIRSAQPDIIALDLLMPKKNGFEVLQEVKSDPDLKNIPVVVLSNLGQDEEIKRALQMGAEDYLVKTQHPINEIVEKFKMLVLKKSK